MEFRWGDKVRHVKSGAVYIIIFDKSDEVHLESSGKIAYGYKAKNSKKKWIRCAEEMEDGRFELVKE